MKLLDNLADLFSFSKLDCFSKCPRRFFFRYVLKRREDPADRLLYGRAVHKGMEHDNKERARGRLPPLVEVVDAGVAELEEAHAEAGTPAPKDVFQDEYGRQVRVYEESGARARIVPDPASIEAPFEIDLKLGDGPPATLQGFVDVVSQNPETGERAVVDYKSGLKAFGFSEVDGSLQFPLYEVGAKAQTARVVSFVKGGRQKPTVKVAEAGVPQKTRLEKALTWVADTILAVRDSLRTGRFPKCAPSCLWCSKRACQFYDQCYGEGSAPPTLVQVETIRTVGEVEQPEWRGKKKEVK